MPSSRKRKASNPATDPGASDNASSRTRSSKRQKVSDTSVTNNEQVAVATQPVTNDGGSSPTNRNYPHDLNAARTTQPSSSSDIPNTEDEDTPRAPKLSDSARRGLDPSSPTAAKDGKKLHLSREDEDDSISPPNIGRSYAMDTPRARSLYFTKRGYPKKVVTVVSGDSGDSEETLAPGNLPQAALRPYGEEIDLSNGRVKISEVLNFEIQSPPPMRTDTASSTTTQIKEERYEKIENLSWIILSPSVMNQIIAAFEKWIARRAPYLDGSCPHHQKAADRLHPYNIASDQPSYMRCELDAVGWISPMILKVALAVINVVELGSVDEWWNKTHPPRSDNHVNTKLPHLSNAVQKKNSAITDHILSRIAVRLGNEWLAETAATVEVKTVNSLDRILVERLFQLADEEAVLEYMFPPDGKRKGIDFNPAQRHIAYIIAQVWAQLNDYKQRQGVLCSPQKAIFAFKDPNRSDVLHLSQPFGNRDFVLKAHAAFMAFSLGLLKDDLEELVFPTKSNSNCPSSLYDEFENVHFTPTEDP